MFGFYGTENRNESDGGALKPRVVIYRKVLVYYSSQRDLWSSGYEWMNEWTAEIWAEYYFYRNECYIDDQLSIVTSQYTVPAVKRWVTMIAIRTVPSHSVACKLWGTNQNTFVPLRPLVSFPCYLMHFLHCALNADVQQLLTSSFPCSFYLFLFFFFFNVKALSILLTIKRSSIFLLGVSSFI